MDFLDSLSYSTLYNRGYSFETFLRHFPKIVLRSFCNKSEQVEFERNATTDGLNQSGVDPRTTSNKQATLHARPTQSTKYRLHVVCIELLRLTQLTTLMTDVVIKR